MGYKGSKGSKGSESIPTISLTSVERALRESLQPPDPRDVFLYAFSRRTVIKPSGSIRIDHPLPIVAIGSVLKDTEQFSKLLTSGFAETSADSHGAVPQYAGEGEYDYDSDSDLDEFEEVREDPHTPAAGPSNVKEKLKDANSDVSTSEDRPTMNESSGKVLHIPIRNIAYRTLRACVFYLYTGKINFLPLISEGPAKRLALLTTSDTFSTSCSPKSAYRLAEMYGITELQDRAFDEIVSRLTPENIVEEAFSNFFARYDRLREHAVSYLSQHYAKRAVQASLSEIINQIVFGDLPHTGAVLRSLLGLRVAISVPLALADTDGASSTRKTAEQAKDADRATAIPGPRGACGGSDVTRQPLPNSLEDLEKRASPVRSPWGLSELTFPECADEPALDWGVDESALDWGVDEPALDWGVDEPALDWGAEPVLDWGVDAVPKESTGVRPIKKKRGGKKK